MKISQAKQFGSELANIVHAGDHLVAMEMLTPLLSQRIPFKATGTIGEVIGSGPIDTTNHFLSCVADTKAEGAWPIIGMALNAQLERDFFGTFNRCRDFIIDGDIWYCADILSERVPGPALLYDFPSSLEQLIIWREHNNAWVRRSVGVAVHFWGKRTKGKSGSQLQAVQLLDLLRPLFTENEMNAVKGIGWGIKTIGRYYPDLVADWLINEVNPIHNQFRSIMLNKSIKFLPSDLKDRVLSSIKP